MSRTGTFISVPSDQEGATPTLVTDSNRMPTADLLEAVSQGLVAGHSVVHKFGHALLGTTVVPVTTSLTYQTPSTAQALEIVSTSASDTAAGTGARSVTVTGLNADWVEISQTVSTNGTTAVALPISMTRVYKMVVSGSGTYATATAGSHVGIISCRGAGGGVLWGQIDNSPIPAGQSEIGAYTIPAGYDAYLLDKSIFVDSTKSPSLFFFFRPFADTVTAPYAAMQIIEREVAVSGAFLLSFKIPRKFTGPCDIGFMGNVGSGTASVSAEFSLMLVEGGN